MTDYSKPVSAAEVCKRIEESLEYREQKLREEAKALVREADAIAEASRSVFAERMRYEKWQPQAAPDIGSPSETPIAEDSGSPEARS